MITRQLLAHYALGSSLLSSFFLDLALRQLFYSESRLPSVLIAMASVAYQEITATCNARGPIPPEGASESDKSRLFEQCDIACKRYRVQKGKDTLQQRARDAKLGNSAFHIYPDDDGNIIQKLRNKESSLRAFWSTRDANPQCLLAGSQQHLPVYLNWIPQVPCLLKQLQPSQRSTRCLRCRRRESCLLCFLLWNGFRLGS